MNPAPLERAARLAQSFLDGLPERPVGARTRFEDLLAALARPLPDGGVDPTAVVEELARLAEPGLVASAGPRYFGFVIGGSLPAALAADWLTTAWDQNAALCATSPAAAAVEQVTAGWVLELLGLPAGAGVGFVTGCQMANFSALAAARHAVLARAGWNVEENGLQGAPPVRVVVGEEAHATILSALRLLGLGSGRAYRVEADGQGRMRAECLQEALASGQGPTIVCAQAGNVNTGAFDPLDEVAEIAHRHGAWLHVDGAFGLWAAACPSRRHLTLGLEKADSWATDAHKWLNVPYDSGLAIVADPAAPCAALTKSAAYLVRAAGAERDNHDFAPESSRRARGFALYAGLRSLGRTGLADLVERCCQLAARLASQLDGREGARVLNEVVLNQVLVRFEPTNGSDADAFTRAVTAGVQRQGTCWASGTRWQGQEALRFSVSNWSTTEADIDRSAQAVLAAARDERDGQ
jgi:glutamate/tyrosine decarboxylase-like PLP-dependent enzyme